MVKHGRSVGMDLPARIYAQQNQITVALKRIVRSYMRKDLVRTNARNKIMHAVKIAPLVLKLVEINVDHRDSPVIIRPFLK